MDNELEELRNLLCPSGPNPDVEKEVLKFQLEEERERKIREEARDIRFWVPPEGYELGTPRKGNFTFLPWDGVTPDVDSSLIIARYTAANFYGLCSSEMFFWDRMSKGKELSIAGGVAYVPTRFFDKGNLYVDPNTGWRYTSFNQTVLDVFTYGNDPNKNLQVAYRLQENGVFDKTLEWCFKHGMREEDIEETIELLNDPKTMEWIF